MKDIKPVFPKIKYIFLFRSDTYRKRIEFSDPLIAGQIFTLIINT